MYINCRAVEIARYLRVIVVIIDHQPAWIFLQIKPSLNRAYYSIEIVQVYASKQTNRRVILQYLLSDVSKAKLKRILVVYVQPEYRRVFLLVSSNIFDRQLSLPDSTETMKNDTSSITVTIKQLVYLQQLLLSSNKLDSFRK